ncbi:C-type lectin domain family 4 member F-like [Megalobrama amblycephala]|uniref:C-type lectin domain family 4 member F-like n=1 Tax=Megalobrama amblycephala TaxID=75352 RepID=UPI0020145656|nr:C-type lectin domain family 4 member F-like [Megalobrama amblycephala]
MDSDYQNSSFILSTVASGEKRSQYNGNSTEEQENERKGCPKWTKVHLIVLAVSLLFALGGLCILGTLYARLSVKLSAQETKSTLMVRELTDKYNRVREHLRTKDIMVRELTDNYTRVREHLRTKDAASVPAMERELKELMSNYTRVREQLSFYEGQSSDCETISTAWGGKLYFFSSHKLNWLSSRAFCVSKGADLVIITSQSEQMFLISKMKDWYWIGLNDLDTEGRWVWVNNQTLTETGVQFWYERNTQKSEPDDWRVEDPNGEDCGIVKPHVSGLNNWFDVSCNYKLNFICAKKQ